LIVDMSLPAKRYVLVAAIDESPDADAVIAHAAVLARAVPGAEIHLVHAVARYPDAHATDAPFEIELERRRRFVDDRARHALQGAGVPVVGHLLERDAADAILQTAASLDADLVIVGTADRHGIERLLLGSVAQKVARRAACPVLVARPKNHLAARAPDIEPPCADCLREQAASHGKDLWCSRHAQHHPRAHLHYEVPEGFGAGSSLIRP
jgi:nucleotide-binding universal stress UspA family protein